MSAKYTTYEFRPMREYELEFNRLYPAQDYCSTPKCRKATTHVRMVTYQHYRGAGSHGRRDKKLRLCPECAVKFAATLAKARGESQ